MKKSSLTNVVIGVFISLLLVGCVQDLSKPIPESVQVHNYCSTTLYLEFDPMYFSQPLWSSAIFDPYDTLAPGRTSYARIIRYKEYDFIMHDSIFSRIVSEIKIFKVDNDDTIYLDPNSYNYRSIWESNIYEDDWDMQSDKQVDNLLKVYNSMF